VTGLLVYTCKSKHGQTVYTCIRCNDRQSLARSLDVLVLFLSLATGRKKKNSFLSMSVVHFVLTPTLSDYRRFVARYEGGQHENPPLLYYRETCLPVQETPLIPSYPYTHKKNHIEVVEGRKSAHFFSPSFSPPPPILTITAGSSVLFVFDTNP